MTVWNELLNTTFHNWTDVSTPESPQEHIRCEEYWIPRSLQKHIFAVFNTAQAPAVVTSHVKRVDGQTTFVTTDPIDGRKVEES